MNHKLSTYVTDTIYKKIQILAQEKEWSVSKTIKHILKAGIKAINEL